MKRTFLCLILLFVFSGCTIIKLKKDLAEMDKTALIGGRVESESSDTHPIFIGIFRDNHTSKILFDKTVFAGPSLFAFLVPHGKYDLVSFQDLNGNSAYDMGEPATVKRVIKTDSKRERFTLSLDTQFKPTQDQLDEFKNARKEIQNALPISFGDIADLDDDIFSVDFGLKGFWEPLSFLKLAGTGIFFMEEYSPDKIPVLFVNGAASSPLSWKMLMENIDKEKFQAWFFLYPSGLRIDKSAGGLAEVLQEVHNIYGFKKMVLIAHSMGGLVTYRGIQLLCNNKAYGDYENLFISISTPWNGHNLAASGVKRSPAVVPCWIDMDPASDFIKKLFESDVPCAHHLLFSYAGSSITIKGNSDGSVSLSSMLRNEAQNKAKQVFGFNETHVSILESKEVLKHLNRIMEQYY